MKLRRRATALDPAIAAGRRATAVGRRATTLGLAVALAGLAACGIPADDEPQAIPRQNVPEAVLETTTDTTRPEGQVPGRVYLVQSPDDQPHLVPVERPVAAESATARPTPAAVLEALLQATPDDGERATGITNQIPRATRLASPPEPVAGRLVIDLTSGIYDVQGGNQLAAFGQIVCTVDALDGVDAVLFQVDGEPIEVPRGTRGVLTTDPVTCDTDYGHLLRDAPT